jgi:hypothetical protein
MPETNQLNPKDAAHDLKQHLAETLKTVAALRREVAGELGHLKDSLGKSAQATKTLRDEARVEVRLAGMEAKQSWEKIAQQVGEAERNARHEMSQAAAKALDEAADRMRGFLKTLRDGEKSASPPEGK